MDFVGGKYSKTFMISAAEAFLCRSQILTWRSSRAYIPRSFARFNQEFIKGQTKLTAIVLTYLLKHCVTQNDQAMSVSLKFAFE